MASQEPKKPPYEITQRFNSDVFGLYDPETGNQYVFKLNLVEGEHGRAQKACAFQMPEGVDNVNIPKLVDFDFSRLPREISLMNGAKKGIMVERAKGTQLLELVIDGNNPDGITQIPREDWKKFETAVDTWYAAGVQHGDLGNISNTFISKQGGCVHFEVIDWGGPRSGITEKDTDQIRKVELLLVRKGNLPEAYPGQQVALQQEHRQQEIELEVRLGGGALPADNKGPRLTEFGGFSFEATPHEVQSGDAKSLPSELAREMDEKAKEAERKAGKEGQTPA